MKKLTFIIILLSSLVFKGKAQLAILNSQKVLASMKEFAQIDTLVAKETSGYVAEYNKKQVALNKLVSVADSLFKLNAKAATTTKAIADAQTANKDLKTFGDMANQKITDYKQLLTKPYTDKVITAIKVVAVRAKYMQVLDSAAINVLYLNPLADITDQVIKELKIK